MRREVINRVLLILGVAAVVMIAAGGIYYWKYRKIPRIVQIPIEILRSTSPDWEKPGKYWETYNTTPLIYMRVKMR